MKQPALFDLPATIPSPLCLYQRQPCKRGGRAILGPPERVGDSEHRSITCTKCGATGGQGRTLTRGTR